MGQTVTPMMKQYLQMKEQYKDSFLFFRLGDFYELFFEDAELAAQILEITLTARAGGQDGHKIPMCGVPYHTADAYIKKMITKGHKVAICEQVEDPKTAKGVVKREVVRVITPGTVMEENLLDSTENNFIVFVHQADQLYALVACDLSTGEVTGTQTSTWSDLINEIYPFHASEIVLSTSLNQINRQQCEDAFPSKSSLRAFLSQLEVEEQQLVPKVQKLLGGTIVSSTLTDTCLLMMEYLQSTQKKSLDHIQPLHVYEPQSFLKLDEQAKRNMELVQTLRDHDKHGSLLGLLDETSTAMGARLLKKWIQRPLINRQQIDDRLNTVETFLQSGMLRQELKQLLRQVYDLERLAARVSFGNVNPRDMLQLKKSLFILPDIFNIVEQVSDSIGKLDELNMPALIELGHLLDKAIIDEPPVSIMVGDIFRDGYHPELDQFREANRHGKQWIAELEEHERQRTGIKSLKIGYNRVFGYYIEVSKANIQHLPEGLYDRKQTLTNAERFITPDLKEKEALILEAREKSTDLEHDLFVELRNEVNYYIQPLQAIAQEIARLDCLCSFAEISEKQGYIRPIFNEDKLFRLKESRHPVVEKMLDQHSFVANDVHMSQDQRQILLITGPNMAGKSTYMRQLALIVIMAQMGCYIPADEAVLPVFDRIFTRIGAADDLSKGQSTFMVEMTETRQAITEATANSLILLDEIGRGTATYDGMSLAQAVVEYIHEEVGAKTLFSTHYHELTELDQSLSKLVNIHVACSEKEGKVVFLHKVLAGKSDRSYGIQVAELANMPQELIRRAKQILTHLEAESALQKQDHGQLSLFAEESHFDVNDFEHKTDERDRAYLQEIANLDIVNMTPLNALNFLNDLHKKINNSDIK